MILAGKPAENKHEENDVTARERRTGRDSRNGMGRRQRAGHAMDGKKHLKTRRWMLAACHLRAICTTG